MPMIVRKPDGSEVAVYLPDDWYECRGDVCVYADAGEICFVHRGQAGYQPVLVFDWSSQSNTSPKRATLTAAAAQRVAEQVNRQTMGITPLECDAIVSSSMRAQDTAKRRLISC